VAVVDGKATIDRSTFTRNSKALFLDAGVFRVTNNFIVRNDLGVDLFANGGTLIQFNTIVDNAKGLNCHAFDGPLQLQNNLLARNAMGADLSDCSLANSLNANSAIGPLKFKSPDVAPFDYHITAGSSAVDHGSATTVNTDFDGQPRPAGAASDMGADELQ
ncbi:MAG TPA: choice-of-anchor Q domain-containing protein, partial [Kofleriaceae bacterium]|nr:choice-of-anchor Q domain-containing protein [Kofleriaceae bacterium]